MTFKTIGNRICDFLIGSMFLTLLVFSYGFLGTALYTVIPEALDRGMPLFIALGLLFLLVIVTIICSLLSFSFIWPFFRKAFSKD